VTRLERGTQLRSSSSTHAVGSGEEPPPAIPVRDQTRDRNDQVIVTSLHHQPDHLGRGPGPQELGRQPEQGAHPSQSALGLGPYPRAVQRECRLPDQSDEHVAPILDHRRGPEHFDHAESIAVVREREDPERQTDRTLDRKVNRALRSEHGPSPAGSQPPRSVMGTFTCDDPQPAGGIGDRDADRRGSAARGGSDPSCTRGSGIGEFEALRRNG
jgi:hypothetical protein